MIVLDGLPDITPFLSLVRSTSCVDTALYFQDNTAKEGNIYLYIVREKMKMCRKYRNSVLLSTLLVAVFLLAGCGLFGSTSGNVSNSSTPTVSKGSDGSAVSTVISTPTVGTNNSGTGPIVIQSPTPVPGDSSGAQQLTLSDRTIVIESVSKQAGNTADSTTIALKITVKNTGGKNIKNLATSYQLVGAEGDMFGLQPDMSNDFFGTVAAGSARSGTIVFPQVPSAAIKNLQLLYRSELSQTVFAPLSV